MPDDLMLLDLSSVNMHFYALLRNYGNCNEKIEGADLMIFSS